jgi:hypothetical protein
MEGASDDLSGTVLQVLYGSDVVQSVQGVYDTLQGGDVAVHFVLPSFQCIYSVFQVLHVIPQVAVVVLAATGKYQSHQEEDAVHVFHDA